MLDALTKQVLAQIIDALVEDELSFEITSERGDKIKYTIVANSFTKNCGYDSISKLSKLQIIRESEL